MIQIADGTCHSPILETGGGVLSVVLDEKRRAEPTGQVVVSPDHGSVTLAQVDNFFGWDKRHDEFVEEKYPRQVGPVGAPALVKYLPPLRTGDLFQFLEGTVMEPQERPAGGTGVEELLDWILLTAANAGVDEVATVIGQGHLYCRFFFFRGHCAFPFSIRKF